MAQFGSFGEGFSGSFSKTVQPGLEIFKMKMQAKLDEEAKDKEVERLEKIKEKKNKKLIEAEGLDEGMSDDFKKKLHASAGVYDSPDELRERAKQYKIKTELGELDQTIDTKNAIKNRVTGDPKAMAQLGPAALKGMDASKDQIARRALASQLDDYTSFEDNVRQGKKLLLEDRETDRALAAGESSLDSSITMDEPEFQELRDRIIGDRKFYQKIGSGAEETPLIQFGSPLADTVGRAAFGQGKVTRADAQIMKQARSIASETNEAIRARRIKELSAKGMTDAQLNILANVLDMSAGAVMKKYGIKKGSKTKKQTFGIF